VPKRATPAYYAAQAIAERHMSQTAFDPALAEIHMELSEKADALAEDVIAYRLFCMDCFGKVTSIEMIQAASDEEAVQIAHEMDLGINCEVWEHQRLVARIERQAT
jgi:hypothetical protein